MLVCSSFHVSLKPACCITSVNSKSFEFCMVGFSRLFCDCYLFFKHTTLVSISVWSNTLDEVMLISFVLLNWGEFALPVYLILCILNYHFIWVSLSCFNKRSFMFKLLFMTIHTRWSLFHVHVCPTPKNA